MTGNEKNHICLAVMCRYLIPKEYIASAVIDQKTMIAFAVVAPPEYSLEICIDTSAENPPCISVCPSHESGLPSSNVVSMYHVGETSYMVAGAHDEGLNPFFYIDGHHSNLSCPPDDVVAEAQKIQSVNVTMRRTSRNITRWMIFT